jgi:hypothetical protein
LGALTQSVLLLAGASAGGMEVELRVLGPVEAVVRDRLVDLGPTKQRVLLVSRVGRSVAVDVRLEELRLAVVEGRCAALLDLRR